MKPACTIMWTSNPSQLTSWSSLILYLILEFFNVWLSELKHFVTSCSLRIYVSLFNDNLSVNIVLGNAKEKEKKKTARICYSSNKWNQKNFSKIKVLCLKTSFRHRLSEFYHMHSQAKNCQIWNESPPWKCIIGLRTDGRRSRGERTSVMSRLPSGCVCEGLSCRSEVP